MSIALIRAETQQRCDVPSGVELGIIFHVKQFNVPPDGDGNNGVANIFQFPRLASTSRAKVHHVGVEMAASGAFYRRVRKALCDEQRLNFAKLQRSQHAPQSSYPAAVALSLIENFAY
jgi:hypothetical protein